MSTLLRVCLVLLAARAESEEPSQSPILLQPDVKSAVPFASVEAMQAEFLHRFETVPGFGLERTARPRFRDHAPELAWQGSTFRVAPPQLIGLEDKPTAFRPLFGQETTLREMTNSSLRKLVQTRALTRFETNAVPRLVAGEPIVAQLLPGANSGDHPASSPDQLQILAAVKAGPTCAKCHECAEGTLLGAFSYTLERVGPTIRTVPNDVPAIAQTTLPR